MCEFDQNINDIFDDILMCEEKIIEEGYQEGLKAGKTGGNIEGFHLGYHRGSEIGAELGYYYSITSFHLTKQDTNKEYYTDKIVNQLIKLKGLIENFPKTNTEEVDILSELENIRGCFKRICSLLKIANDYGGTVNMTF